MTLVVDASVAIKWFVAEAGHDAALAVLRDDDLHAPGLILPEATNVAWKKARRGEIAPELTRRIAAALPNYLSALHAAIDLIDDAAALTLALDHPVYDCLYLACAQRIGAPLVTADDRLRNAAANASAAPLVLGLYEAAALYDQP